MHVVKQPTIFMIRNHVEFQQIDRRVVKEDENFTQIIVERLIVIYPGEVVQKVDI